MKKKGVRWLKKPAKQDYLAAERYLSLLLDEAAVARCAKKLRRAGVVEFEAKDLLRASDLALLGASNSHVKRDLQKINKGTLLSPLLLVRDRENVRLIIADGYHSLVRGIRCGRDAAIPCCLVAS